VALAAASQSGPALAAGVSGDLRAGFYFDSERAHIGGGIVAPISRSGHWYINPNLEMALSDVSDLFALSADVEYTFNSQPSLLFWVGGGPSLLIEDAPGGSDTSAGLNLIFGLGGRRGPVRPFGQFKAVLADDSEIVLTGGIRF
jgi:hypothetical protein